MTARAAAGPGEVSVSTRKGGKSARSEVRFLYTPMPELLTVLPERGPIDGGTVLRIEGARRVEERERWPPSGRGRSAVCCP